MKSLLVISRQAPWAGHGAREALDVVLAAGAFELPVAMLFLDDGVFALQAGQQPGQIERKDLGANLQALPVFGIEALYASSTSLAERGLRLDGSLPVKCLDDAQISALLAHFDQLMTL